MSTAAGTASECVASKKRERVDSMDDLEKMLEVALNMEDLELCLVDALPDDVPPDAPPAPDAPGPSNAPKKQSKPSKSKPSKTELDVVAVYHEMIRRALVDWGDDIFDRLAKSFDGEQKVVSQIESVRAEIMTPLRKNVGN